MSSRVISGWAESDSLGADCGYFRRHSPSIYYLRAIVFNVPVTTRMNNNLSTYNVHAENGNLYLSFLSVKAYHRRYTSFTVSCGIFFCRGLCHFNLKQVPSQHYFARTPLLHLGFSTTQDDYIAL